MLKIDTQILHHFRSRRGKEGISEPSNINLESLKISIMNRVKKHEFDDDSEDEENNIPMDSEAVMKEIQRLYNAKEIGLRVVLKSLGVSFSSMLKTPRQKITVLLVGSHYSAKEKFLDLYFNEPQQNEFVSKVNYEKLDRIFITQGNQRRILTGETVLDYCPHLAQLGNVPGLKNYLTTEITSRKTKSLVSFILAPENVDMLDNDLGVDENNNIQYPVKVQRAMRTLAEAADLIFIFFDPTGKTPPSKTLKPFEDLWEDYHPKMHLLLAKASEIECNEATREATLAQVVQQVWKHPQVQRIGYVPQIFCPNLTDRIRDEEQLWNIIQQTADKSIDRALFQLEKDATLIQNQLTLRLEKNHNAKNKGIGPTTATTFAFLFICVLVILWVLEFSDIYCKALLVPQSQRWTLVCEEIKANKSLCFSFFFIVAISLFRPILRNHTLILTEDEEKLLNRRIRFAHHALYRKEAMQKLYTKPFDPNTSYVYSQ
ncbi:unnamed protein product [Orchesella dallaii]|uniref:Uncharacterized protein n=1 Tax=Orchesella dallaii TaxID=48710 RepID=A0ABP1PPR1_9HEXA